MANLLHKKTLYSVPALFSAIFLLSGCAQNNMSPSQSVSLAQLFPSTQEHSLSGNYLAGRYAQHNKDWSSAYKYMNTVLEKDTGNINLLHRTFLLALGNGQIKESVNLATDILATEDNTELAIMLLTVNSMSHDDFKDAQHFLDLLPDSGFGRYTKPLLMAWSLAGQEKYEESLKYLSQSSGNFDAIYALHAGMISDIAGEKDTAKVFFSSAITQGITVQESLIIANFYERIGEKSSADDIYKNIQIQEPKSPFLRQALDRLNATNTPSPVIKSVRSGAGLTLFNLSSLLYEKQAYESALIYNRFVEILDPNIHFVHIMIGDIAAINKQYNQAISVYKNIPSSSALFPLSRLRIAEILEANNQVEQAVKLLTSFAKTSEYKTNIMIYLGDMYRRQEQYDKAVHSYNQALDSVNEIKEEHWGIIYARGMSFERINDWHNAEKDLLQALDLQPNNPLILNYLAYSWTNQGVHLKKSMSMIKKAVSLKPDDGYILDSYGWILYRTGQYDEATQWLEKAVSFVPSDFIINDHLGDAYWRAGRKKDASFQWMRTKKLAETQTDIDNINIKINHGLPKEQQKLKTNEREAMLIH